MPKYGKRFSAPTGDINLDTLLSARPETALSAVPLCLRKEPPPALPYEFGVSVRLEDETGAAGLVFASASKDDHYGFYPSNGRLRLTHFRGPTVYSWQILTEFGTEHYRPGEWNHLKIRLENETLRGYVNDQLVLTWPLDGPLAGRLGLAKFRDTRAQFKGFQVGPQLAPTQLDVARVARRAS